MGRRSLVAAGSGQAGEAPASRGSDRSRLKNSPSGRRRPRRFEDHDGAPLVAIAVTAPTARPLHAPPLSVEERARINTSEMWSEPIDPDAAEPIEIE